MFNVIISEVVMPMSMQTNDLSYFKLEKTETLLRVQEAYMSAVHYYDNGDLEWAEKGFVQVLKPFLSKPEMKIYICQDRRLQRRTSRFYV